MTTATTQFTVVVNTVSQSDLSPSVGVNDGSNGAGFNYPTYVPVQVPAPVPGKEARITNVSMPSIVLPNATFNIIVTFATFVAPTNNFAVHLTIPQLSLDTTSTPVTLSNLARGSTIFTVTLPIQGAEGAENASGIVTGQLDLLNQTTNSTDDGTPISFRVQGPSDSDSVAAAVPLPPPTATIVPTPLPIPPPDTGGTVVILPQIDPQTGDLDIDVHGFIPFEPVDLDFDIPMAQKTDHQNMVADKDGHFNHSYHFQKDPTKQYVGSVRVNGHNSHKQQSRTVNF